MLNTPSLVSGEIIPGTPLAATVPPLPGAVTGAPVPTELHDPHPPTSLLAALRRHSPLWVLIMIRQVLWARVLLRRCTLGKWVRVRGRVRVMAEGPIAIGDRVRFRAETAPCELATWGDGRLEIGAGTTINYGTSISAAGLVRIGEDCLIGTHVNIMDCTFHNLENRAWSLDAAPVVIGDRVWLGNHSVIMKGVTIGEGAVVAACSLVTRDVPPNTMVVGVPARVVKNF